MGLKISTLKQMVSIYSKLVAAAGSSSEPDKKESVTASKKRQTDVLLPEEPENEQLSDP